MPTLVGLLVLAAALFTALGILDAIRGRILVRIGGALDETLSGRSTIPDASAVESRSQ
jgi:ATP-binding cassette subfamily C protein